MKKNDYFNRQEFYSMGSYINDKYVLKNTSKKFIKDFLRENTYYTDEKFRSMSDIQLYQTFARIRATIKLYIKEIQAFVIENPEIFAYKPTLITQEQYSHLDLLTYNELSNLRQKLHIDKRYKPLVLVKDTTPKTIVSGVQEEFHRYTLEECLNKIEEKTNYVLITTGQGFDIFGEDFSTMSSEELKGFGYKLAVSEEENKLAIKMHNDIKEQMIDYMEIKEFISPNGDVYSRDMLSKMNLEDLKYLYLSFQRFYQGMPNYDGILQRALM